jgi:hypothetical protein
LVADAYVKVRVPLLGNGAFIKAYRISSLDPALKRLTQIKFMQGDAGTPRTSSQSDPSQVDLLVRLKADASPAARNLWLSGLPDAYTNQLVAQGMEATFLFAGPFKKYLGFLTDPANALAIRAEVKPRTDPRTYQAIPIRQAEPIMIRKKDRGRPFNLFRGRRLA